MVSRAIVDQRPGKSALALWIGLIVLTGTYFRARDSEAIPDADWLVVFRLLAGAAGIALGSALIKKHGCRLGGKAVLAFVVAAASSAAFSPYWQLVLGYWIVLAGGYVLTVGLVGQSDNQESLDTIEHACFLTLLLILLKDSITELAFLDADAVTGDEPFRLGMGLTHSNTMAVMAALAFWMSFKDQPARPRYLFWPARLLLITILVLSRSRMAMIGWLIAGALRSVLRYKRSDRIRAHPLLVAIPCGFLAVALIWILAMSWEIEAVADVVRAFNRGEDMDNVTSITGRTPIWTFALAKISESPLPQLLFGHGFGTSRFILNDGYGATDYYAAHAHNSLLEIILSMGVLGAIPFILTVVYSLRWMTDFARLHEKFSSAFSLRAVSALSIILLSSITEAFLGNKLGPIAMIYVFYVTALDKYEKHALAYRIFRV